MPLETNVADPHGRPRFDGDRCPPAAWACVRTATRVSICSARCSCGLPSSEQCWTLPGGSPQNGRRGWPSPLPERCAPRVPGAGTTPVVPPSAADAWGDARRDSSSRAPQRQAGLGKERGTQVLRGILTGFPRTIGGFPPRPRRDIPPTSAAEHFVVGPSVATEAAALDDPFEHRQPCPPAARPDAPRGSPGVCPGRAVAARGFPRRGGRGSPRPAVEIRNPRLSAPPPAAAARAGRR